jgi:hypothetical protein
VSPTKNRSRAPFRPGVIVGLAQKVAQRYAVTAGVAFAGGWWGRPSGPGTGSKHSFFLLDLVVSNWQPDVSACNANCAGVCNLLDFFGLSGNKARKVRNKIRLKHLRKKVKDKNLKRKHKV